MKIGIIGAGLAGLTCAWYLKKNNIHDVTIFESSEWAGGKLHTTQENGFLLDRGFQVLLPAYPETKKVLDYKKLELQSFAKGSLIVKNNKKIPFYDPENGLASLVQTVVYGPGTFWDKLLLLKLKLILSSTSVDQIFDNKKRMSSMAYLKEFGFSEKMIQDFWVPFYQGVFLENTLETDSSMLLFTFKMFAEEGAAVPKEGMKAIPAQLVDFIGENNIRFKQKVQEYTHNSITTEDGKTETFDKVVVACNLNKDTFYHSVTNWYFETDKLPINTKHIILNANPGRTINNVVLLSNVAPNYAQNGKHLISVSANGIHPEPSACINDLISLFGEEVNQWKWVQTYVIKESLPKINFERSYSAAAQDGVFYCGDYLIQGSINGAMESGRRAAEEIIALQTPYK
ncbi:MAG: FAD-dependent oxidoreductase [Bacteroidia bacterium]|nr:FAD-dependent oxidoreductase [Bacteroidia bacterium]